MQAGIKTLALALWAPLLSGALAAAITWVVWYYTTPHCTPETAIKLMCQPTPLARYLSPTVLHDCIIHAGIAITLTGGSDLMLFLRERKYNEQERQRTEQVEQRAERMMEFFKDAMEKAVEQAAEERRQSAEERQQATEERQQAAAERVAFLEALNRLTEAINQNGRNRE